MKIKQMSELEEKVMNIVWHVKEGSVRDVMVQIDKPMAYTTVLTVLQRLHDKGLVIKKEKGKAFIYSSAVSREQYSQSIAKGFLSKFISSFGEMGIASFAQSIETLSEKERHHLIELLEQHEKNK